MLEQIQSRSFKDLVIALRRPIKAAITLGIISAAYILSFAARFDFKIERQYWDIIGSTLPVLAVMKLIFFYRYGLFSGMWRYASMDDLWRLLKGNLLGSALFVTCVVFTRGLQGYPRSVFVLDFLLCMAMMAGIRFFVRSWRERFKPMKLTPAGRRTLIVGAGEAGIAILKEMKVAGKVSPRIVGFLDDDPQKRGARIHGVNVIGTTREAQEVIQKEGIEEIIIAIPSADGQTIREIIGRCTMKGVKIKIVPGLLKILDGDMELKVRDVQPEDLLGRESVKIDRKEVKGQLGGKRVLVTGAAGSIGSELCRQIASYGPASLAVLDNNENDMFFLEHELRASYTGVELDVLMGSVQDKEFVERVFRKCKPQVVYHAAAHKHVPLMEAAPDAAVKNNILGTRIVADAAVENAVERFVFISTDKAVNPTSVMGASKRVCEMIIQAKAARQNRTKFMAVRFGNVLGSKGSVIPLFKQQIDQGGPVTVTHAEARRFFMSIREAVELVLQAGAIGSGGEIFVLDMGEQIKIVDLAKNLVAMSGLEPGKDIEIRVTGLRPGEKLYEEPLHDRERDMATRYDKIFIAKPRDIDGLKLDACVSALDELARVQDANAIIRVLKELIPEYSNNGCFAGKS